MKQQKKRQRTITKKKKDKPSPSPIKRSPDRVRLAGGSSVQCLSNSVFCLYRSSDAQSGITIDEANGDVTYPRFRLFLPVVVEGYRQGRLSGNLCVVRTLPVSRRHVLSVQTDRLQAETFTWALNCFQCLYLWGNAFKDREEIFRSVCSPSTDTLARTEYNAVQDDST